ncbi:MAG TPA: PEP-CTERM sorting domain-containing protein [Stellaceae bacterium]|nr:PEP-CTERM sorting domain-containing protein [Stellaceae bacterium]
MRFGFMVVAAGCLFALFARPAAAVLVEYDYVGMPFAVTTGPVPPSVTNLSGDFQIDAALLPLPTPSLDDITSLVSSFSFTDGNQTLTNLNTSNFSFEVTLDSAGHLVSPWEIDIGNIMSGPGLQTVSLTPDECDDMTWGANGYQATIQCFPGVDNKGTWSGPNQVLPPPPVPEPSSLLLLAAAGLAAIGAAGTARRRLVTGFGSIARRPSAIGRPCSPRRR